MLTKPLSLNVILEEYERNLMRIYDDHVSNKYVCPPNGTIPVELGRFWVGEYDSPKAVMDSIKKKVDAIVAG